MSAFPPEQMMRSAELTRARRLLRRLDNIYSQSRLDAALPRAERRGYEAFSELKKVVWANMDALVTEVWKREVGLERYSVVHVRRGNLECRLQVLTFSFHNGEPWGGHWMWVLQGRALRKDGTLGLKDAYIGFRFANLQRRHLDGIWHELHWREELA